MRLSPLLAIAGLALGLALPAAAAETDWSKVAGALGKSGTEMPGGVYRVGLPRSDLRVTVDGVAIKPSLALGGWLAFQPMGAQAMVMGDLVLTEGEINPVMARLLGCDESHAASSSAHTSSSGEKSWMEIRSRPVTPR